MHRLLVILLVIIFTEKWEISWTGEGSWVDSHSHCLHTWQTWDPGSLKTNIPPLFSPLPSTLPIQGNTNLTDLLIVNVKNSEGMSKEVYCRFCWSFNLYCSQNTFVKYQWEGSQQKCQVLVMYHYWWNWIKLRVLQSVQLLHWPCLLTRNQFYLIN